jgi:hypothetical protein
MNMNYAFMTLMWDDTLGEGFVKFRDNYGHTGWVTKMDFLTDVISELEAIKEQLKEDIYKSEGTYRF